MEVAELFRPPVVIEEGLVTEIDLPTNTFYCHAPANLVLFVGKEPHLRWRTFGQCIFQLAAQSGVRRIVFVGSFGGPVPHTRQPRLYVTCSDAGLLAEMEEYGVRRSGYQGPSSFTTYLMTQAKTVGREMVSLVAEIPGYLQGTNPASIEAVKTTAIAERLRRTRQTACPAKWRAWDARVEITMLTGGVSWGIGIPLLAHPTSPNSSTLS